METKKKLSFHFFALAAYGTGISGSDKIFIEFSRRWGENHPVTVYLWEEGRKMCEAQRLRAKKLRLEVSSMHPWRNLGFLINYLARIFEGIKIGLTLTLDDRASTVIYSASDFLMDSLPCWVLKKRFPKITWVGSWYLTAPNPIYGFEEGSKIVKIPTFGGMFYWISQRIAYPLIRSNADLLFITSDPDKKWFPDHDRRNQIFIVKGGVDMRLVAQWRKRFGRVGKLYDGVFQGRFHAQKGVRELIDIWELVCKVKPEAKLAMIGGGTLFNEIHDRVRKKRLDKNIQLTNFIFDGEQKFRIFAQSKVVVHPVVYDSGGMAAAEAMAWGLPAVSFDLEALKTYYPKGMIKVRVGDLPGFAEKILELLGNQKYYQQVASDSVRLIREYWDWDSRSKEVMKFIRKNLDGGL